MPKRKIARKSAPKPVPAVLRLVVDSHTWVSQERDPEDEWSRDSTTTSHEVKELWLNAPSILHSEDVHEVPVGFEPALGQEYHVVCAQYSTGDSFGHDEGRGFEVVGIYTDPDFAEDIVRRLEAHDSIRRHLTGYSSRPVRKSKGFNEHVVELKLENGKGYKYSPPWTGYFESLDWVRSYPLTLE